MKNNYFLKREWTLWFGSLGVILLAFLLFDQQNYLSLAASMIGVTSLIFNAKGNPLGQLLMVVFSVLYGLISWSFAYYGEMVTYLGMTMPMAFFAFISWLRHPYKGNRAQVEVNRLKPPEYGWMSLLTAGVTLVFYFILKAFDTAYLPLSVLSVTTSFIAVYLTFRRSPYFALAYAANDVVLIALWVLATLENRAYLSVVICFIAFLFNDLYGFICWRRMERRQIN